MTAANCVSNWMSAAPNRSFQIAAIGNCRSPSTSALYKLRWRIEAAFNRLKDFRRIATRYDRLARNYLASVRLAAALVWWMGPSSVIVGQQRFDRGLNSSGPRDFRFQG